jgi:ATP-dependent RNA circularization protein (DNA/RNA ligase family)
MLYPKIQSVFKRDPDNNYRTFLYDEFADEAFGYLWDTHWIATEKIDGTNMRIHIGTEEGYTIGGRNENSEMHVDLYTHMVEIGDRALVDVLDLDGLILYGEGYGPGIQKGGEYREDKGFILFDVMVTETSMFLERDNVMDIAVKLDLPHVPRLMSGPLSAMVEQFISDMEIPSAIKPNGEAEGWVIRPAIELRNRRGDRVITKLKVKDFPERA